MSEPRPQGGLGREDIRFWSGQHAALRRDERVGLGPGQGLILDQGQVGSNWASRGGPEEDAMSAVGQGSLHPRPRSLEAELGCGGQFRQAGSMAPRLGH